MPDGFAMFNNNFVCILCILTSALRCLIHKERSVGKRSELSEYSMRFSDILTSTTIAEY